MAKDVSRRIGSRILDQADADRFAVAADAFVAASTVSQESARKCLREMGLIDAEDKPTEFFK